jgi:ABC-type multidrug transport system fused ATPase/permease subunit
VFKNGKKIFSILSKKEKKSTILMMFIVILISIFDVVGIASIMPFMAMVTNPSIIEKNEYINFAFNKLKFENKIDFMILIGCVVFCFLIISVVVRALGTFIQLRFSLTREYSIAQRLINCYLYQPYSWFLNQNSSDLGTVILSETSQVVNGALMPLMQVISQLTVSFVILVLLFIADPQMAIIIFGFLSLVYGIISLLTRRKLKVIGEDRLKINKERFNIVSEAFGGIKEVKLGNFESVFSKRFQRPAKIYAKYQTQYQIIGQIPRFVLDILVFGGLMLIVISSVTKKGGFSEVIPIISFYAISSYRLIPALQMIYVSMTSIKFAIPSVDYISETFKNLEIRYTKADKSVLNICGSVLLKDIEFTYPNSENPALRKINIEIPIKSKIGFIGQTGSGKSTLVDLILGLLKPSFGEVIINNVVIDSKNIIEFQKKVGYVPQQIYLADDTIAANIAFGVDEINYDLLYKVSKLAKLHDFIISDLPQNYNTSIGERGVRLSGGQRQRIGIARALYKQPEILVLDEATSALDNKTESDILDSLDELGKELTIITVAHRLTTVKNCDCIYILDKGSIIDFGKFHDLSLRNSHLILPFN